MRTKDEQKEKPTNEALSAQAKAGDRDALAALWGQNRGLLVLMFRRLAANSRERMAAAGVTLEDLEQEGYFAIAEAVQLYDPGAGVKFITFLRYPVMKAFYSAVGLRTQRQKREPLNMAASLDEALKTEDGDGSTRGELVPDVAAGEAFAEAENRLFNSQLHEALEECLRTIPLQLSTALRCRFYEGKTQTATAATLGVSQQYVNQLERKALRAMRSPKKLSRLSAYSNPEITARAYSGTGFMAWKRGGSSEERAIEWMEEIDML